MRVTYGPEQWDERVDSLVVEIKGRGQRFGCLHAPTVLLNLGLTKFAKSVRHSKRLG